jgi:hypothetical protein
VSPSEGNTPRAWPAWLAGGSLAALFRADRTLGWTFALLCASAVSPLFMTPICPQPDLHGHLAGAALLLPTAFGQDGARQYYAVNAWPVPYWSTYIFMALVGRLVGPLLAAKALIAVLVCLLPLATMRLLRALGRDPRLGLWAFLLSWDANMHAAWHAYLLGMSLSLVLLARLLEARDTREAARSWPLAALVALSHVQAAGFAFVTGFFLSLSGHPEHRGGLKRWAAAMSGMALVVVPWVARRFQQQTAAGLGLSSSLEFHSASQKLSGAFAYTLDALPGWQGEVPSALAFVLLLLGPLVLARLPEREGRDGHRWASMAVAAAALSFYVAAPFQVVGPISHWATDRRYLSFVLLGLLFIPRPRLDGERWLALLPGVALAIFLHGSVAQAYRTFGRHVQPFMEIIDATPRGARLLPLEYEDRDSALKNPPLAHLHSNITAIKLGYDPHLYDYHSHPIVYRQGLAIPRISWFGPQDFALSRYAAFYSHILVQGLGRDPLAGGTAVDGFRTRLVVEAGIWRLYAIDPE